MFPFSIDSLICFFSPGPAAVLQLSVLPNSTNTVRLCKSQPTIARSDSFKLESDQSTFVIVLDSCLLHSIFDCFSRLLFTSSVFALLPKLSTFLFLSCLPNAKAIDWFLFRSTHHFNLILLACPSPITIQFNSYPYRSWPELFTHFRLVITPIIWTSAIDSKLALPLLWTSLTKSSTACHFFGSLFPFLVFFSSFSILIFDSLWHWLLALEKILFFHFWNR